MLLLHEHFYIYPVFYYISHANIYKMLYLSYGAVIFISLPIISILKIMLSLLLSACFYFNAMFGIWQIIIQLDLFSKRSFILLIYVNQISRIILRIL